MSTKPKSISIDGLNKADALTHLIQNGMDFKEAEAYWKENGSKGKKGYAADFFNMLIEKPMSDIEFVEWLSEQSENARKHKSHYDNVRMAANAIHSKYK
jgi:hypothetical protein